MPNGGADCCGTCCFNSLNEGKHIPICVGKKGIMKCIIRDIEILRPFFTYCANHPRHNRSEIDLPIGPVFIADLENKSYRRIVWLKPSDNENIRLKLLSLLNDISNEIEQKYPTQTSFEEEIINQLLENNEKRAIPSLLKIINMDIEKYRFWDNSKFESKMVKNKAIIVGLAIEALLILSGDEYLSDLEKFINIGLENIEGGYNSKLDNFSIIRYHLVRGLKFLENKKSVELLNIAKEDLHDEVKAFAIDILNDKIIRN